MRGAYAWAAGPVVAVGIILGGMRVSEGGEVAAPVVEAPRGYVRMQLVGTAPTGNGEAAWLTDRPRKVLVPVGLGATGARDADLENTLAGGRIVEVRLDGGPRRPWVATLVVDGLVGADEIDVPARLGLNLASESGAPIYVDRDALSHSALTREPDDGTPIGRELLQGRDRAATDAPL